MKSAATAWAEVERLKSERDEARAEAERLRAERRQLRARLVECRRWVGVCPIEPAKIREVCLVRDLADDTLEEVRPWPYARAGDPQQKEHVQDEECSDHSGARR